MFLLVAAYMDLLLSNSLGTNESFKKKKKKII